MEFFLLSSYWGTRTSYILLFFGLFKGEGKMHKSVRQRRQLMRIENCKHEFTQQLKLDTDEGWKWRGHNDVYLAIIFGSKPDILKHEINETPEF